MGSVDRVKPKSQKNATTQHMTSTDEYDQIACYQATQNYLPELSLVTEFTVTHPIVYNASIEEHTTTLHTL